MFGLVLKFLGVKGCIAAVLGLALVVSIGALNWEHSAKLKAQAERETYKKAQKIGYEAYIKLYQEREQIKEKAHKIGRRINEGTLDDLVDLTNNPDGMRRPALSGNSQGSSAEPARYRDSQSPYTEYEEAR